MAEKDFTTISLPPRCVSLKLRLRFSNNDNTEVTFTGDESGTKSKWYETQACEGCWVMATRKVSGTNSAIEIKHQYKNPQHCRVPEVRAGSC